MTLILGGSGQMGTALRDLLPNATAPSHDALDLGDIAALRPRILALAPDRIINCAAYTAVDAAESDEDTATTINGTAVGELAAVAAELKIPFVTVSTDYVFDGTTNELSTETTQPNPLSAYGRSKLLGEQFALRHPTSLVIRTSWMLSPTHSNFVTTILSRAAEGEVRVVDDQWGRPPMPADLAAATLQMLDEGARGLVHLAGEPTTSWHGLAREACRLAGIDPVRAVVCSSDEVVRPARRPRHAVLASVRRAALADWRTGLAAWLTTEPGVDSPRASHPAV